MIDGQRFTLPAMQYALLKVLATEPQRAVPSERLAELAWPDYPGMTRQDVHWHVFRARKFIGDREREQPLLANNPGFGYYLDLPADSVRIIEPQEAVREVQQQIIVLPDVDPEPDFDPQETPIRLDELPGERAEEPLGSQASSSDVDDSSGSMPSLEESEDAPVALHLIPVADTDVIAPIAASRKARPLLIASVALVALLSAAILAIVGRAPAEPWATTPLPDDVASQPKDRLTREEPSRAVRRHDRKATNKNQRSGQSSPAGSASSDQQVITATVPDTYESDPSDEGASAPQESKPAASLPPAPANELYHLHDPETGDHFVTTDPTAANEYRGRGYVGGAIARVYARSEDGTKPISTNGGTAFIFATSRPKTDPAVRVVPLYLSTDGAGDFFYTTSQAEAAADGWSSSLVGYVGAP